MDIHKPKPVRTWREFLKELGTIALGVGIALAAEQAVERWREHRQYLESRDAMRFELATNFSYIAQRPTISACASKRIAELTALLDKAEKHEAFDPPRWIGGASGARVRWVAETDAGRSGLFSPLEQRRFANVYSYMHSLDIEQDRERLVWARLQPLENRASVPPEMLPNLREALAQAQFEDERIVFMLELAKTYAQPLGLTVPVIDPGVWPDTWPHCVPLDTPRAEALRRSAYHMDLIGRVDRAQ